MSKTIAVIFGGNSNENEISVITGTMAANVLESGGDSVIPVYISQNLDIYAGQTLKNVTEFKNEGYKKASRAVIADGGIYILNARGRAKKVFKGRRGAQLLPWRIRRGRRRCGTVPDSKNSARKRGSFRKLGVYR